MSARTFDRDAVVSSWAERDRASALQPADHEVVESSCSIRGLIADLARSEGRDEELFDACAVLGRLIAEAGGSATLASLTIDHACEAIGARGPTWLAPARAAVAEGFARALIDRAQRACLASWEFPSSTVRVDDTTLAIAAYYPSDDDEVLAAWAARLANGAARNGIRRALVAGPNRSRSAVAEALGAIGIEWVASDTLRRLAE